MRHPVDERLARLLALLAWLGGRGPVPIAELCERYHVTEHQLRADLDLADGLGGDEFELSGECVTVAFFDDDTVEVTVPEPFHRQPTLNRAQAFALVAVAHTALALDPGVGPLASALAKVEEALDIGEGMQVELPDPVHLAVVRRAEERRERLEIVYWSAWRDELTTRQVDPVQVFYSAGAWYVRCLDHASGELRLFRVDRIEECRATGERFEAISFTPSTDVFDPPPFAERVTVRFPERARWVPEYVACTVTDEGDGDGFVAELTSVGGLWLERLLLRSGGEVLAPPELAGLRGRAARSLLARYGEN